MQLQLEGRDPLAEQGGSAVIEPALLMQVMEVRERIAAASDEAELRALMTSNSSEVEVLIRDLEASFAKHDTDAAARDLVALQYLTKIQLEIEDKAERLGLDLGVQATGPE